MSNTFLLIASFPESIISFRGELLKSLCREGLKVHIAAPHLSANPTIYKQLHEIGIQTHDISLQRTGMNPIKDVATVYELYRLMKKIKPNFLLAYTIKPVIYSSIAGKLAKVPYKFSLITGLGYAFTDSSSTKRKIIRKLIQSLYRLGLSYSKTVFFQNPDDELLFRKLAITNEGVSTKVLNGSGINLSEYRPASLTNEPVFLMIARLLGDKGVREYAKAAKIVKQKHPQAKFLLVGWIDDNPDSISEEELSLWTQEGTIEYLGKKTDVKPTITQANIYVLPSYREGTPRTVLEAMAMGRAIITTDAPGCRETVVENKNGFLVSVQSTCELVDAMERFITDPALIHTMGSSSRHTAENKYDVHKVNKDMLIEMGITNA